MGSRLQMIRISISAVGLSLIMSHGAFAGERGLIASSGKTRVQLLELYSSESCSSCPPADEWVSQLKDKAGLWKQFVPVVFHVTYWNNLGWVDKFSKEAMTQRQIDLAKTWPGPRVYTPAMVVDGKEWSNWRSAKEHQLPSVASNLGINLSLFKEADGSFSVKSAGLVSSQKYTIRIAQLGMDIRTKVSGGENSGEMLSHNFLVLNWDSQSINGKISETKFKLNTKSPKNSKLALVAWIEEDGNPIPLQAVGGYL